MRRRFSRESSSAGYRSRIRPANVRRRNTARSDRSRRQIVKGFGHQGRAFAVGPRKTLIRAAAHVVDVGVIETRIVPLIAGCIAVESDQDKVVGHVGPGLGDGADVGLSVMFEPCRMTTAGHFLPTWV